MSVTLTEAPAVLVSGEIPQDRWGRPLLAPAPGAKPVPYTRASTIARTLDDPSGLIAFKQRQTALGLAARPDLVDALTTTDPADKRAVERVVDEAARVVRGDAGKDRAAELRRLTAIVDLANGRSIDAPDMEDDLAAYAELTARAGWTVLGVDVLTACHACKIAGRVDRVIEIDGDVYVAAIDTRPVHAHPTAWAIDLAAVAQGKPYDTTAGQLTDWPHAAPRTDRALLIHLPVGAGTATAYWIDIAAGAEALDHAVWARAWRRLKNLATYHFGTTED